MRRSLFMLPMFRVCVFSGRFSGGGEERSFAMGSVPFCSNGRSAAPAATVASGEARTPPHGGKNDRHKRRGCLTRCRRPFFIRTAFRELFRIRNFRRVKKLVRQPPLYSYCSGSLPERAVHERSKKSSDKTLSALDRMRSASRRNVFPAERPPPKQRPPHAARQRSTISDEPIRNPSQKSCTS